MSIFDVTLTPADLPQPPAPQGTQGASTGYSLEYYGPGASGAVASPHPNGAAEISPVFGGEGPG